MKGAAAPQGLLFDLDGTLVDSRRDIADSANQLRLRRGLPALPVETIGSYIGGGIESLVQRLMGEAYQREGPALVEEFRRYYHDHCADHSTLYPGVAEVLAELSRRGYPMAVVTNKPQRISVRILELLGVASHFRAVVGGDTTARKKPHPDPLWEACRLLALEPAQCWLVGDSRVDVEAARAAGMACLGLRGGIGDEREMLAAGPARVLDSFRGLLECLPGSPFES